MFEIHKMGHGSRSSKVHEALRDTDIVVATIGGGGTIVSPTILLYLSAPTTISANVV